MGEAVEFLLANGHGSEVFTYTPRRIVAFMWLAQRRARQDLGKQMWAAGMGARGKESDFKKELKDLLDN